jgi:hypothetical protein
MYAPSTIPLPVEFSTPCFGVLALARVAVAYENIGICAQHLRLEQTVADANPAASTSVA